MLKRIYKFLSDSLYSHKKGTINGEGRVMGFMERHQNKIGWGGFFLMVALIIFKAIYPRY